MQTATVKTIARTAAAALAGAALLFEVSGAAFAANYANMSCGQLWYARNAIYAQQGYCFQTKTGQKAFPNSCFPPYGKLNSWQAQQVANIQYWERAKGCS